MLPILLYAVLHSLNFIIKLATELGYGNSTIIVKVLQLKSQHASNLLSTIACAEIFVFPIVIVMIFMLVDDCTNPSLKSHIFRGKANFFVPFVYYRFLTLRYLSRRNPYTRYYFIFNSKHVELKLNATI